MFVLKFYLDNNEESLTAILVNFREYYMSTCFKVEAIKDERALKFYYSLFKDLISRDNGLLLKTTSLTYMKARIFRTMFSIRW